MNNAYLISVSTLENQNAPHGIVLSGDTIKIGRKTQITMDTSRGKEISKYHALISRKSIKHKFSWEIVDKHSLNGTFLNGKKIQTSTLKENDELVFGGGPGFSYGDRLRSTDKAECRYVFVYSDPLVYFTKEAILAVTSHSPNSLNSCSSRIICSNQPEPMNEDFSNETTEPFAHSLHTPKTPLTPKTPHTPLTSHSFEISSGAGTLVYSEVSENDCAICYERMIDPVVLPCSHKFCMHCLSGWQKQCQKLNTEVDCPICRAFFDSKKFIRSPLQLDGMELTVYNCEWFLFQLGVESLDGLEDLALFNEWTEKTKKRFWDYFQLLENSKKKKILFTYLVSGTYQQVQEMDEEGLRNVLRNLGGKVILQGNENDLINLRGEALRLVGTLFHGVKAPDLSSYVRPHRHHHHHHF